MRQQCGLCGGFLVSPKRRGERFRCGKCKSEFVVASVEDVQSVVDGMKSALDYSDDESMKEIVARIEAASGATPTKEGE